MAIPELRDAVLDSLAYEDLSNTCRTSQAVFRHAQLSFVSSHCSPYMVMLR